MRYFELLDHIGVAADGELEPIREVGVAIAIPLMVDGEIVAVPQTVVLRPVQPGARIVATDDPRIVAALAESGQYREVDPPASEQPHRPKSKED